MKIRYKFCDGTVAEEEVSDGLYTAVQEIEQYERGIIKSPYKFWVDSKLTENKFKVQIIAI